MNSNFPPKLKWLFLKCHQNMIKRTPVILDKKLSKKNGFKIFKTNEEVCIPSLSSILLAVNNDELHLILSKIMWCGFLNFYPVHLKFRFSISKIWKTFRFPKFLDTEEIRIFSNELGNYQPFYKILGNQIDNFVSFFSANPSFTLEY